MRYEGFHRNYYNSRHDQYSNEKGASTAALEESSTGSEGEEVENERNSSSTITEANLACLGGIEVEATASPATDG